MDTEPKELSMEEIRKFMVLNNYKLTNHTLVKHFRSFLTNKDTQGTCHRYKHLLIHRLVRERNLDKPMSVCVLGCYRAFVY